MINTTQTIPHDRCKGLPLDLCEAIRPEQLALRLDRVSSETMIPVDHLRRFEAEAVLDDRLRHLRLRLNSFVAKPSHPEMVTEYMEMPATWWEHWKQDHAPHWFLDRFPVLKKKVPFTFEKHTLLCPHVDEPWPEGHVRFLSLTHRDRVEDHCPECEADRLPNPSR